jgi:hypothetical protein
MRELGVGILKGGVASLAPFTMHTTFDSTVDYAVLVTRTHASM